MQEITDGTAKFRVVDKRMQSMFNMLYPIGIVVTTATDNALKPGEADGLAEWDELAIDRVLQGAASGAGQTIEAGLPNIKGKTWLRPLSSGAGVVWDKNDGALTSKIVDDPGDSSGSVAVGSQNQPFSSILFDASQSNNIYGKSDTVQPLAYKVHFWKRVK